MSDTPPAGLAPNPDQQIPNTPVGGPAPFAYISAADATTRLQTQWGITGVTLAPGHLVVASMACDQEGPFYGVKLVVEQEREWPRTFMYGFPNVVWTPSPVIAVAEKLGAWLLNYEGVIPDQVVDWTCLEAYRMATHNFDYEVASESVTGASVRLLQWGYEKNAAPSQLDKIQMELLTPFQMLEGHQGWLATGWNDTL